MHKRLNVELDLPEEITVALRGEDMAAMAKEALVMELLREHYISQGKAAEILGISREYLFLLMTKYRVPVIDLSPAELESELKKPLPPG